MINISKLENELWKSADILSICQQMSLKLKTKFAVLDSSFHGIEKQTVDEVDVWRF